MFEDIAILIWYASIINWTGQALFCVISAAHG